MIKPEILTASFAARNFKINGIIHILKFNRTTSTAIIIMVMTIAMIGYTHMVIMMTCVSMCGFFYVIM